MKKLPMLLRIINSVAEFQISKFPENKNFSAENPLQRNFLFLFLFYLSVLQLTPPMTKGNRYMEILTSPKDNTVSLPFVSFTRSLPS